MPMKAIPTTSRRLPSRKTPNEVTSGGQDPVNRKTQGPAPIYAVVNRGGGTGKTTTSSGLAAYFAAAGYATLLIEMDDHARAYLRLVGTPKRNAPPLDDAKTSVALLHPDHYSIQTAAFRIDLDQSFARSGLSRDTIERVKAERGWQTMNTLDLIPGSPNLRNLDGEFAVKEHEAQLDALNFDPNAQLAASLRYFQGVYDVIVVDSPAGLGKQTWNALMAARYVLMPMAFDPGSIEDYDETHRTFQQVVSICQRKGLPAPTFIGYVGNFFKSGFSGHQTVFQSYVGPHPDPDTKVMVPAAIPYPMLGCLPLDEEVLWNAWAKHMTVHTSAPLSDFGKAMYDYCVTAAKAGGLR
jgi:cellulose biosynthesis protein BcsQ